MAEGIEKRAHGIDDPPAETHSQAPAQRPTAPSMKTGLDVDGLDDPAEFGGLVGEQEDGPPPAADPREQSRIRLLPPDPGVLAELSPWRWGIAFAVIAMLLALFCFIVFWGLTHSSWWY